MLTLLNIPKTDLSSTMKPSQNSFRALSRLLALLSAQLTARITIVAPPGEQKEINSIISLVRQMFTKYQK